MPWYQFCPKCNCIMEEIGSNKKNFSGGKALIGAAIAGPIGLAAGALGKNSKIYRCPMCGYIKEK